MTLQIDIKNSQGRNMIWHFLGREKTLVDKFGRRQCSHRLKHACAYFQLIPSRKGRGDYNFRWGHKSKITLLINYFFFFFLAWKFSLEFSKTENNKVLKMSILPLLAFRDDIFDSLVSTCTTYDEGSFMSCRAYHSQVHFSTILCTDACGFEDLLLFKRSSQGQDFVFYFSVFAHTTHFANSESEEHFLVITLPLVAF